LKYDAEADWYLLTTCNARCSYCFLPLASRRAKLKIYGSPLQWTEAFNSTGKTWLIHITGGEPSMYPDFIELCEYLTQNHYVSINTNLTHDSMRTFAQRIDPERVNFINVGVHIQEKKTKESLDAFIERALELKTMKFSVLLSQLMTPQVINDYPDISSFFKTHGLFLIPKVIQNMYQGKKYPDAYSPEQKNLIRTYVTEAKQNYNPILSTMQEPPTILFSDLRFVNATPDHRGKLCDAGRTFIRINPNGTAVRCFSQEVYGNILFKDLKLLDTPKPCNTSYCPYWCYKYLVKDKELITYQTKSLYSNSIFPQLKGITHLLYYMVRTGDSMEIFRKGSLHIKKRFFKTKKPHL
jgi:MoaA/NifB/PqqE/SkfB family radical SAM enzyme